MLPVPEISSVRVSASLALIFSELMDEFSVKVPTALAKPAGLLGGNGFTLIVKGFVVRFFFTSAITSCEPKKVETLFPEGTEKTISILPAGMVI